MAALNSKYSCVVRKQFVPPLKEVADLLSEKLKSNFAEVQVEVVDCPDLKKAPFHLAGSGLCGNPTVADVGGVPYLMPLPQLDRKPYSFTEIGELMGFRSAFVLGAACSPFHKTVVNCEMMPNLFYEKTNNELKVSNETHCAKIDKYGKCELFKIDVHECCLLGNVFVCEGKPGKVLKINVKKRIGNENFTGSIRKALHEKYGNKAVSLGGVFLLKRGTAKFHVMPEFSKVPLNTEEDMDKWLKFFPFDAPMICLSVLHSFDDNLDLRIEHTHCFSTHGVGGHYHYDTTPDEVEYEAYFNVADTLYRIDAPRSKAESCLDVQFLSEQQK